MYGRVLALVIFSASLANTANLTSFSYAVRSSHDVSSTTGGTAIENGGTDAVISESPAAITGAAVAFLSHSGVAQSNVVPGSIELYRPMDLSLAARSIPELSSAGVLLLGLLLFFAGLADRRIRKRHRPKQTAALRRPNTF